MTSNWQELRELTPMVRALEIADLRSELHYWALHIDNLENVALCQEFLDRIKALIMSTPNE